MKQTYTIPADRREDIEKLVAKYQRKAEKYGLPLIVEYGEPHIATVPVYERNEWGILTQRKDDAYSFEAFDLTIDGDDIRKDGYTVVAKIEHLEGGNIVTAFTGEARAAWQKSDCRCEHCNTSRARRLTFIVRHENGSELQVGRSCLKDYCGIDPQAIGARNELSELILDFDINHYDFLEKPVERVYETINALAFAIATVKHQGYIRSGEPGANKEIIAESLIKRDALSEIDLIDARRMAEEIINMSDEDARAFLLDNVQTLIRTTYCKATHVGFIAYAPVAIERYHEELKKRAKRAADHERETASEYVGEIGKRMTFSIDKMTLVTSWETQYGWTYLYKFIDTNGNVLVWFASKLFGHWTETGEWEQFETIDALTATVKDHTERDGVKQTIITRCKAA